MKKILTILACSLTMAASAQKKDTLSKPAPTQLNASATQEQPTDSTAIISLKDLNSLLDYLQDKMIAKDYLLVQDALNQLYTQRFRDWIEKRKKATK